MWFIDRNLVVSYRGEASESWTQGFTCMAGLNVTAETKVIFFMVATPGQANQQTDMAVSFNYVTNFWTQETKWAGNAACLWTPPGATVPVIVFGDGSGNVEQQTPGVYMDNGAAISRKLQTSWWGKEAGEQGYARIPLGAMYGQWSSTLPAPIDSKLQVLIGYDFEPPGTPVIWDPTSLLLAGTGTAGQPQVGDGTIPQYRFFVPPGPRGGRVERISLAISDVVNLNTPNDPGFQIDMVSLAIERLGGLARMGPLRTTG
jgi:hypothetical protein